MNIDEIKALHKKYAPSDEAYKLVYEHCEIVAKIAEECGKRYSGKIDLDTTILAALLHDIGTYTLFIPELHTFKEDGYQQHALIGAAILEEEGIPSGIISAVRTHVLMGLSAEEIKSQGWKIPYKNYMPETVEAELLCYADRFHSKHPRFNHHKAFLQKLEKALPEQARKFKDAIEKFGLPDIDAIQQDYGHPIR